MLRGFVLAAGLGTRLRPLTDELPKALVPLLTTPAIHFAIRLLARAGIEQIWINLHHHGEQIRQRLGDGRALGVRLSYSHEPTILGTGGGLRQILPQLDGATLVVVNADTLIDVDLSAVVAEHQARAACGTMVLRRDARQAQYGQIAIDRQGRIQRFLGEGPACDERALASYMFAGVHVLQPRLLEYLPPGIETCVNRYGYLKALHNGEPLYGHVSAGPWLDLGTPAAYHQANMQLLDRRVAFSQLDALAAFAHVPKKEVEAVVRLGQGATLGEGALLTPPVVVGAGAQIGPGARVGPYAVIGAGAQVGAGAVLREVVVLDGARVAARAEHARAIVTRQQVVSLATA